jgi:hypothetical protein
MLQCYECRGAGAGKGEDKTGLPQADGLDECMPWCKLPGHEWSSQLVQGILTVVCPALCSFQHATVQESDNAEVWSDVYQMSVKSHHPQGLHSETFPRWCCMGQRYKVSY